MFFLHDPWTSLISTLEAVQELEVGGIYIFRAICRKLSQVKMSSLAQTETISFIVSCLNDFKLCTFKVIF